MVLDGLDIYYKFEARDIGEITKRVGLNQIQLPVMECFRVNLTLMEFPASKGIRVNMKNFCLTVHFKGKTVIYHF